MQACRLNTQRVGQQKKIAERSFGSAVDSYAKHFLYRLQGLALRDLRGFSSAGRAPALQAGGQRFDPANLHQMGQ